MKHFVLAVAFAWSSPALTHDPLNIPLPPELISELAALLPPSTAHPDHDVNPRPLASLDTRQEQTYRTFMPLFVSASNQFLQSFARVINTAQDAQHGANLRLR